MKKALWKKGFWPSKGVFKIYKPRVIMVCVGVYILDAVTSSGILKAKQKLGVNFNFDKQDVIDLTKFSKMTMCMASEANSEK